MQNTSKDLKQGNNGSLAVRVVSGGRSYFVLRPDCKMWSPFSWIERFQYVLKRLFGLISENQTVIDTHLKEIQAEKNSPEFEQVLTLFMPRDETRENALEQKIEALTKTLVEGGINVSFKTESTLLDKISDILDICALERSILNSQITEVKKNNSTLEASLKEVEAYLGNKLEIEIERLTNDLAAETAATAETNVDTPETCNIKESISKLQRVQNALRPEPKAKKRLVF